MVILQVDQALISDRYAVGVPGQVFEDLLSSTPLAVSRKRPTRFQRWPRAEVGTRSGLPTGQASHGTKAAPGRRHCEAEPGTCPETIG
jgi:hypothetical protein